MNQILIYNGEPLYLKEGFPERPEYCTAYLKVSPTELDTQACYGKAFCECRSKEADYDKDLQRAIDKALRFEDRIPATWFSFYIPQAINAKWESASKENILIDGAYKLPDGWRVEIDRFCEAEVKGFDCICKWNQLRVNCYNFARLVPVEKQEKELFNTNPERDWTEDFSHENGNYQNRCIECKQLFNGHKRRVICKKCMTPNWVELSNKRPPEDTKENKAWHGAWLEGEMVGYAKCMVEKFLPKLTPEFNTTASDKTPSPVKTAEEVYQLAHQELKKRAARLILDPNYYTWESNKWIADVWVEGYKKAMEEYASQFRGEMTTK